MHRIDAPPSLSGPEFVSSKVIQSHSCSSSFSLPGGGKNSQTPRVKYWEIMADNIKKDAVYRRVLMRMILLVAPGRARDPVNLRPDQLRRA
jgi:hypothetical protein